MDANQRFRVILRLLDILGAVITYAIKYGAFVYVAYLCFSWLKTLSGKVTIAEIILNIWGRLQLPCISAFTIGILGVIYGMQQYYLRSRTIERMAGRINMLESKIDPNRTSSKLTEKGATRKEDEL